MLWDERKSASEYQNLADAAYSRSYADWLIGMNGSRIAEVFLPKKRTERISLGRVQTATLAILVDHEIEILKHILHRFGPSMLSLKEVIVRGMVVGKGGRY